RMNNGTRSCGCLLKENPGPPLKHGYAKRERRHPLYNTWRGMRARCNNPNAIQFKDWGGRGIQICKRWDDPAVFINDILTSIGPRPPGMVLDRINNDGNYEPGNVKWSTYSESRRNTRPPAVYKNSRSGIRRVRQHGHRWRTVVRHNGKLIHI